MPERLILVADDNDATRYALGRLLQRIGYKVLAARDGNEALAVARLARPAAAVLDVHMPGLDGFETCRALKADASTAGIPVVFVSAARQDRYAVEISRQVGALAYLFSPVLDTELQAVIEGAIARAAAANSSGCSTVV